jgi:hypothetical protein
MIDVREPLRITSCAECGIVFGLSEWLWQKRAADGGEICCPNGHRHKAADAGGAGESDSGRMLELLAELRDVRHKLAVAEMVRPSLEADSTPDREELKRRSRTLSNTAQPATDGGRICPFCGSKIAGPPLLHTHIMRRHLDKLGAVRC